jgi:hypothetical protein
MQIPDQFYTIESMLTLTGASGVTFIVCNGIQRAFNFNPKWLALVVAIFISFIGVYMTGKSSISNYFVGLINGFLIYATAAGATEIAGSSQNTRSRQNDENEPFSLSPNKSNHLLKRKFASSWFNS